MGDGQEFKVDRYEELPIDGKTIPIVSDPPIERAKWTLSESFKVGLKGGVPVIKEIWVKVEGKF